MLKIEINESTPANMLRAIRAACNELLGEHNISVGIDLAPGKDETGIAAMIRSAGGPVEGSQFYRVGEQPSEQTVLAAAFDKAVETVGAPAVAAALVEGPAEETDSAGHTWNAELHASTKSKNADGTWKKRRGAAQAEPPAVPEAPVAAPPLPPAAPTTEPIMPKIFALITSQIVTINQAVEAAQAEGFADLGANGLGGAPREAQEAVLRKLEGQ